MKATGQAAAASLGVAGSTPVAPLDCANSLGNPCSQEWMNWQNHLAFPNLNYSSQPKPNQSLAYRRRMEKVLIWAGEQHMSSSTNQVVPDSDPY